MIMELRQRTHNIDTLWELVCDEDNNDKRFELINGELFEMSPPGEEHGLLATWLGKFLIEHAFDHNLGRVTTETGYYPSEDKSTLLSPDVAFRRLDSAADPPSQKWVPVMPDLAVEIMSPSNTMTQIRRKAEIYLQNGTQLVWIIIPKAKSVEVCRLNESGGIQSEVINQGGSLSGEDVLPEFELHLAELFAW